MRSQHVDRFNHDDDADEYDDDVKNEAHPVRNGYAAALTWVVAQADVQPSDVVVDLGIGTGNLARQLPSAARLIGVDVSIRMMASARAKLGAGVELVEDDLLAWAHRDGPVDVVVSSFAVHHLTDAEKSVLFAQLRRRLAPGGRMVFADLAFESAKARAEWERSLLAKGRHDVVAGVNDEFFWDVAQATASLEALGFRVLVEQFGPFIWGIAAW